MEILKILILELIVHVEVAAGENLEEGFPIKVDFGELFVFLVVEIGIGESMMKHTRHVGSNLPPRALRPNVLQLS